MIIDESVVKYMKDAADVARLVGMESLIIEDGRIRALHEDSTVAILHTTNVPELEFGAIGIGRLPQFVSRYNIAAASKTFFVEAEVQGEDDTRFVRSLTMKSKNMKVDFRCANPSLIRAPKSFSNDLPEFSTTLTQEVVDVLVRGVGAMQAEDLVFTGEDDKLTAKLFDVNGDELSVELEAGLTPTVDIPKADFSYTYPIKLLQTVFKAVPTAQFYFTTRGLIKITVHGFDVYILPKV